MKRNHKTAKGGADYWTEMQKRRIYEGNKAFLAAIMDQPPVFRWKFAWKIATGKGFELQ